MRKTVLALAAMSSLLAVPGHARDGAVYVGAEGGVLLGEGPDIDVGGLNDVMHLRTNTGWDAGAVIGYDLGNVRIEAEGAYKSMRQQRLDSNTGYDVDSVSPGVQEMANVDGKIKIQSFMANVVYDIGDDEGATFFAGAGAGYAKAEIDSKIFGVVGQFLDDKAKGFAWQLIAGVRIPVTRTIELGAKYRYFNVDDLDLVSPQVGKVETDIRQHALLTTLTLNFGG